MLPTSKMCYRFLLKKYGKKSFHKVIVCLSFLITCFVLSLGSITFSFIPFEIHVPLSLSLPTKSTLSPIIINELLSQSKALLTPLWLWSLNSPRLFVFFFPFWFGYYHFGCERDGDIRREEDLPPHCVLGWQIAAVMNVCDSSALHTPSILIEFFIP